VEDLTFQIVILRITTETQDEVMRVTLDNPLVRAKGFHKLLGRDLQMVPNVPWYRTEQPKSTCHHPANGSSS